MELVLHLNARLQPIHRAELEDQLQEVFELYHLGNITGGGTAQAPDGEIKSCDIEFDFSDDEEDIRHLIGFLNRIELPKGSVLIGTEQPAEVGTCEGMAVYLDGRNLPAEVYKSCDVNYVIEQLGQALDGCGEMKSYWEGSEYTALYFYGTSFVEMKERVSPFLAEYPLCENCRVTQIA